MRHSLQAEGFGIRLRPVRMEDAAFIVWLRNLEHVRGKVGDSATDAAGQEAWLEAYFEREGDYYFIPETPGGIPLGTTGIYDVRGTSGEKGRHIMRPEVTEVGVPAGMLATDLAFDRLGLSELRSNSVSTNLPVHSLHRKSGFKQVGVLRAARIIEGRPVDLVEFILKAEDWPRFRERLAPLAYLAGAQALAWEKTQLGRRQPWEKTGKTGRVTRFAVH
jgi:RimJ/RimL family protein N-acetyltransferase